MQKDPSSTKPEIIYFDIRGRAEPIRLLLEDLGIAYQDTQITLVDWPAIRSTMPFHRMPVYRDGDLEIPETFAILGHLGRQHDLLGSDEAARIRCDVAIESWRDYGNRSANVFGALSDSDDARKAFIRDELPERLGTLETFLQANPSDAGVWAGDSVTIADFAAFHLIEGARVRFPKALDDFPGLSAFCNLFSARPRIHEYLHSSRRPAALFYGPKGKIYPTER